MYKMRNEALVTINARKWKVRLVTTRELGSDKLGDCDHPPGRYPTMRINRNLPDRVMMDTIAHECLHAALPQLSEEAVTHSARIIGLALYSLGFRRKRLSSRRKANT
jgi:hypothetical protein